MRTDSASVLLLGIVAVIGSLAVTSARQPAAPAVPVDADDLGGVVAGDRARRLAFG
jgi:hypothetical protein